MNIELTPDTLTVITGAASGIFGYFGGVIREKKKEAKRAGQIEERCATEQMATKENRKAIDRLEDRVSRLEQGFTDCQTARGSHFDGYSKLLCAKMTEFEKRMGLEIRAAVAETVSRKKKRGKRNNFV